MAVADCASILVSDVPRIDAQHRRLFELAATFADGGDQIRMMKSLAILCDHVKTHFREEEEMMAACGFPGLDEHRRQHGECRRMLVELLARAMTMSLDQIADEVQRLIHGWIYNHILTADCAYAVYLKAMPDRASTAPAG
ncbi:bacteriohemerythrin [Azospira restricta]|uniref:Hemerythrin family protein n=1 Tax=Azospira restricta TaxID=404405 RepID=A0A974SRT0_9RHOO|nr:hemerythrin family protein [Azospira restricta]QRJ65276.1 hemerythrin family protein [Azospira restricta]